MGSTAWPALWADHNRVYVAGGGSFEPISRLTDLGLPRLLDQVEHHLAADTVVFITAQLWTAWGQPPAPEPDERDAHSALHRELAAAGWRPGRCDTAWISAAKGPRWVRICVLPWTTPDSRLLGAVDPDDVDFTLARQLEYRQRMHGPLHTHPGTAGMNTLRENPYYRDKVTWSRPGMWDGVTVAALPRLGQLHYSREADPGERDGLVLAADRHMDYLAAMGNVRFPARPLIRLGKAFVADDPKALHPGWYLARWSPAMWDEAAMGPNPVRGCPTDNEQPDCTWIPEPLITYLLVDRGLPLALMDAYVTPGNRQGRDFVRLDAWTTPLGRQLSELRYELSVSDRLGQPRTRRAVVMEQLLKAAYASGYRQLATPGGRMFLPYGHDAILAMSAATMHRHTDSVYRAHKLRPLKIEVDCVWYAVGWDKAVAEQLLPPARRGDAVGQWQVYPAVPFEAYEAAEGGKWW